MRLANQSFLDSFIILYKQCHNLEMIKKKVPCTRLTQFIQVVYGHIFFKF